MGFSGQFLFMIRPVLPIHCQNLITEKDPLLALKGRPQPCELCRAARLDIQHLDCWDPQLLQLGEIGHQEPSYVRMRSKTSFVSLGGGISSGFILIFHDISMSNQFRFHEKCLEKLRSSAFKLTMIPNDSASTKLSQEDMSIISNPQSKKIYSIHDVIVFN